MHGFNRVALQIDDDLLDLNLVDYDQIIFRIEAHRRRNASLLGDGVGEFA